MRIIPTKDKKKIAIIAATKPELTRLQVYRHLSQFSANITTQPEKSEQYQCYWVVYTFESGAQARLFRLAYSLAKGRFKRVRKAQPDGRKPPAYYRYVKKKQKEKRIARAKQKKHKRGKARYTRLIPILKAGNIAQIEAKARQIAREQTIIDLL